MTPMDAVLAIVVLGLCAVLAQALFYARPEDVDRYSDTRAIMSETSDEDPRDDH